MAGEWVERCTAVSSRAYAPATAQPTRVAWTTRGQAATSPGPATASHIRPIGNLDCNGYSPVQRPVKPVEADQATIQKLLGEATTGTQ